MIQKQWESQLLMNEKTYIVTYIQAMMEEQLSL